MGNRDQRQRAGLSRALIVKTALEIADRSGVDALTMRGLGAALGVEAMSLYNHVSGKEDLIDGMIDLVYAEIGLPEQGADWRHALRDRYLSARSVLGRHTWAIPLMESRQGAGLANLRHHDAVLGLLRTSGFDLPSTATAYSVLDSYLYGFALTEKALPFEGDEQAAEVAAAMLAAFPADEFPHLAEIAIHHVAQPGYDYGDEFERGLDLVLDGLERLRSPGGS